MGQSGELLQRRADGVDRAQRKSGEGDVLQATTQQPHRKARTRVGLVALCALVAAAGIVLARIGPAGAATYPLVYYGDTSGNPICDVTGDQSPDYSDITCNSTDHASAYIGSDGTDVSAGCILDVDPRTNTNQRPRSAAAYVIDIASRGPHVAGSGVDGRGPND